jgi:hypothetical protein
MDRLGDIDLQHSRDNAGPFIVPAYVIGSLMMFCDWS